MDGSHRDAGDVPRARGRAAARAVQRHGEAGARRTVVRVVGTGAALVLVVLIVHGLRRASGPIGAGNPEGPLAVVEGEVEEPGVVPVAAGASLCDVVELAGGDREALDPAICGRAAVAWTRVTVEEKNVTVTELSPGERFAIGGTLDPNMATVGELGEVPGLSEALATRVVEGREQGPYCAIEELERVRGIGPRKIEWMRPFLSIDGVAAGCPSSP